MPDIATALGVSRTSVSLWTRDIEVVTGPRRHPVRTGPNRLQRRKSAEIQAMGRAGTERIGCLSEREFLVAGVALYAGEGCKHDGCVKFTNSDPRMVAFFVRWLLTFFEIDADRLRVHLYLHEGLDLEGAIDHWVTVTGIPAAQFIKPYRAVPDPSIRKAKHEMGCASVYYGCSRTHRAIMGLTAALLTSPSGIPG